MVVLVSTEVVQLILGTILTSSVVVMDSTGGALDSSTVMEIDQFRDIPNLLVIPTFLLQFGSHLFR